MTDYQINVPYFITVKHFLFARTLFLRKFARAERRENKVLPNNSLYKNYRRRDGKSRNYSLVNKSLVIASRKSGHANNKCFTVVIRSVTDVLWVQSRFVKFVGVRPQGSKYVSNRPYNNLSRRQPLFSQ